MKTAARQKTRLWRVIVAVVALALLAAACGQQDGDQAAGDGADGDGGDGEDQVPSETLTIGWIPWEEDIANTFLWMEILERKGYDVEAQQLEVAAVFQGVADGTVDMFLDAWLPETHGQYKDEFGENWVNLGTWFEEATLELTVPTYVAEENDITSLNDLPGNADLFDGKITGIESGAGMMGLLRDEVMPAYNLGEEYELVASSTPAMRSELQSAIENEEPIVVTLWTPHPAYGLHDLTRLDDPKGAWGEPEHLDSIAREGFEEDFPQVAEWMGNFEWSREDLASLQSALAEAEGPEDYQSAASDWLDDNMDIVNEWLGDAPLEGDGDDGDE